MKGYCVHSVSTVGATHLKKKIPCQDRSACFCSWSHSAIAICDGHGGRRHFRSGEGASIAISVCKDAIGAFCKKIARIKMCNAEYEAVYDLAKHIIAEWRIQVYSDYRNHAFSESEMSDLTPSEVEQLKRAPEIAYGSTLLLAVACNKFFFVLQIGDGNCRLQRKNELVNPFQESEEPKFGMTDSLCSSDALQKLRLAVCSLDEIKGCVLSSDGVRNSFQSDEYYDSFCRVVLKEGRMVGRSSIQRDLSDFLPKLSSRGSGDDVSVAIIKHMKNVKK